MCDYDELFAQFKPNPFASDFECTQNDVKGGIFITENILYGWYVSQIFTHELLASEPNCFHFVSRFLSSVRETDWSLEMAELIVSTDWKCSKCECTFNATGIQKLQHANGKVRKRRKN